MSIRRHPFRLAVLVGLALLAAALPADAEVVVIRPAWRGRPPRVRFRPARTVRGGRPGARLGPVGRARPPPPFVAGGWYVPPPAIVPAYGAFVSSPVGGTLRGLADLTAAQGQYLKDIKTARILREQSRQMALETRRQMLEAQLEYERLRPTAADFARTGQQAELEWARNFAQNTEIWSGSTLNVLLDSIIRSGRTNQGPTFPLDDDLLGCINVTYQGSRANGGLFKNDGNLVWPEALEGEAFDALRGRFTKFWDRARREVKKGGGVERATLRDLQRERDALSARLGEEAGDLTPTEFIQARRSLNQFRDALRALEETRSGRPLFHDLRGQVQTVAELAEHM